jgi:hypothetical protein
MARGGKGWTWRDEITTSFLERLDMWGNYHAQQWGAKKPPDPIVFDHPDRLRHDEKPQVTTDHGAIARFFQKFNGRR